MESNIKAEIFNNMADQSDEVYFIFNIDENRFEYINEAFKDITKRETSKLLNDSKLLFEIIHQDDVEHIKEKLELILKEKTKIFLDFRICRPDKTERWIRLKVYPFVKKNKIAYLTGTAEDDTARKTSIFNMEKVNGWKDANLEILSHDLRGPIGTIQMLSSIIERMIPGNKDVQKLTRMIADISKRNINLIQALLTRETLDTADVEISLERLDVVWEVHQVMDIYIEAKKDIKKDISYTHSHDHIFAELDSMKFLQIVNNLVSNAIKFTHDHGRIKVHVEKLEKTFLITVSDDGIGIPKSLQPLLFKKYTEAGRTGVEGEKSVGLGTWIIKTLTEVHKGNVWFESEPKKGTTFYVEIPFGL